MNILGISAYYHDSAAVILVDGEIVAACQEERFSRVKHDSRFPSRAVRFCLDRAGLSCRDLDLVVFYEKPLLKFERLLHTYFQYAPIGFKSFYKMSRSWLGQKLFLENHIVQELSVLEGVPQALFAKNIRFKILFSGHHESHGASAFFPSPFPSAAVITVDGVGEWTTTTIGVGSANRYRILKELRFPHSLGLLYSAFTHYLGFKVNSGEYKVMGLAPYGELRYSRLIRDHLINLHEDGSFELNMRYFDYCTGLTMTHKRFHDLFGAPPRRPESEITQRDMDIARSIQEVLNEAMVNLAREAYRMTGEKNLCMAGGVALNCVANSQIMTRAPFKEIWIQPAADDAGGALGAAYIGWFHYLAKERQPKKQSDSMKGAQLGPAYPEIEIERFLKKESIPFRRLSDHDLCQAIADAISQGAVVGWFQGAMEFGPRALGNRSILGNPLREDTQSVMNLKIKYRESFRPFAPSILEEKASHCFDLNEPSPYMLFVAPVAHDRRVGGSNGVPLTGLERLKKKRSDIPAVTHVDYSARVQTVREDINPRFHLLLNAFYQKTGYPLLVNTSFNVRGEPIVCTYEDAYHCFMRTEMDYLVLGNFVLRKSDQPPPSNIPTGGFKVANLD